MTTGKASSAFDRRAILAGAAIASVSAGAGIAASPRALGRGASSAPAGPMPFISTVRTGVEMQVSTASGIVAGYNKDGIYTFKGVPYGADTGGANRFMPPRKPAPWAGVRASRAYGGVSPQDVGGPPESDDDHFTLQWDKGYPSENCLSVNVWTPELRASRKRPVMVWLHGGGFVVGSGHELPFYDGENLARSGDVVVVTINHRLGVVGFLDLSGVDPRFEQSGNVGMLDIIAALEWVRDNIAAFGGDAGNVTIFGQSGGGAKVSTLMAMPRAAGLFHKAIVQSGSMLRGKDRTEARDWASAIMAELKVTDVAGLQAVPWQQLLAAVTSANEKAGKGGGILASAGSFGPVVDGALLPQHPFDPKAPAIAAKIPLLVGSVANETPLALWNPQALSLTEDQLIASAVKAFGQASGKAIVAAYRKWKPDVSPFELQTLIIDPRIEVTAQADRQAANGADVFVYLFSRHGTVLDGKLLAHHNSDLPYVFNNIDKGLGMTGGGLPAYELADRMSKAWAAFAHSGNPSHPGIPAWPKYQSSTGAVMIFDNRCEVLFDPDREGRRLIEATGKSMIAW